MREEEKKQESHPAERQPLFNKLEHTQTHSAWHNEAQEWSKTGRSIVEMLKEAMRSIFS